MDPVLYDKFFEIEDRFWWSVGTRRAFFDLIADLGRSGRLAANSANGKPRAVDVGCGTGVMLQEFPAGWGSVTGCDFSELALTYCRRRGIRDLVRCDATRLPFPSDSIDLVLALDVVEHLADDRGCLGEIARVCRPGGHALLHVPAFQILWSDKDELNHHQRRYRRADFIALVERSGLVVERSYFINSLLFPAALARSAGQRIAERLRPRTPGAPPASVDHLYRIPEAVNRLMTGLMRFEWRTLSPWIPFGMSFVCVAGKPPSRSLAPTERKPSP